MYSKLHIMIHCSEIKWHGLILPQLLLKNILKMQDIVIREENKHIKTQQEKEAKLIYMKGEKFRAPIKRTI